MHVRQALEVLGAALRLALPAPELADLADLGALPNCESIPSPSPLLGGSLM